MMKGFILSLQFLTRIKINTVVDFNKENLGKSTFFFPLVGGILGGIGAGVYYVFSFINRDLAALATVVSMIILTGGLHLDGLADTFDGFLANKDKETTLDIMKDSRIGAFGVIGLVVNILAKYVIVSNLLKNLPIILILSLGNSRLVLSYKMIYKKIARPGGLGHMFHRSNPKKYVLRGGMVYTIIVGFLNPIYLIPLVATIVASEIICRISYKKIGGLTGDVYGAIIEIGEIVSLITFMGVMN